MLAIWSLVLLPFLKPAWTSESSRFMYCWSLAWRILSITLLACAAAAAAKSLQSWPTLCDPIDGSPPGSPIPGILQARTLEWVAISFYNAWKWKVKNEREVAQSQIAIQTLIFAFWKPLLFTYSLNRDQRKAFKPQLKFCSLSFQPGMFAHLQVLYDRTHLICYQAISFATQFAPVTVPPCCSF